VEYIPALALVGRIWLGELTNDATHRSDVERIVAPYVSGGKPALPSKFSGSHLAGHLIFSELARTSKDKQQAGRYGELARLAGETGFDAKGQLKEAMPAHNEMSDALFMGCPILVEAWVQTGEEKYLKMAMKHFQFMRERVLRADGIYRHSPLCETAWGRGNGFPALGLAWSLSDLPKDHSAFQTFLKEFQQHIKALVKHQDPDGTWHQVVDDSASYREFSCTCMIAFSMIRGVRQGWLAEATYRPVIEKAFHAIKTRIAADGTLVDVCTGTGKQKSLRDYYDRKAILGRDARGGAMALLVTTEMARWQLERQGK
jgi:rhamnogalacturonyl hydrolase YesR